MSRLITFLQLTAASTPFGDILPMVESLSKGLKEG